MSEKKPFTKLWKKAKKYLDNKDDRAVPLFELMIINCSKANLKGIKEIEGVKVDLWLDRSWLGIESLQGLPEYKDPDFVPKNKIKLKNSEEFISLFDYFGYPVGPELGKEVYEEARKLGKNRYQVRVLPFKYSTESGKESNIVMLYEKGFLENYFGDISNKKAS